MSKITTWGGFTPIYSVAILEDSLLSESQESQYVGVLSYSMPGMLY
jgi:hypothetical protein